MPRIVRAVGLVVLAGLVASSSRADDFGRLLEREARQRIRGAIARPAPGPGPASASTSARHGEPFAIRTADGWTLVAHRYRPTAPPRPGALPVILCHGLTYNALFWDLDPACSFAEYLAAQGFDVWAVSLRGCGLSQKWVWKTDEIPAALAGIITRRLSHGKIPPSGFATIDPKYANWDLDHHIAYDVPALVTLVKRHTGAAEVAWVGHSMGGIVAIGHLARFGNPGIGRLATIGSQVTMPRGRLPGEFCRQMIGSRQKQLGGQALGNILAEQAQTGVHNLFFNVANVDPKIYQALSGGWATDIPAIGLMEQYMNLTNKGILLDAKQRYNYAEHLGNIKVPMFISCGASDQFAPPVVQQYLFDHVGSADKRLVVFGRSGGQAVDAGHDDALVGLNSRAQVYPVIAGWLAGNRP